MESNNIKKELDTKTKEEVWHLGQGTEVHNSTKCTHYFIQKSNGMALCRECGLGVFGHVQKGKLL